VHAVAGADAAGHGLELVMMLVSVAIAAGGIALAHHFYVRQPEVPVRLAARFQGIYRTLWNKYWVDELYAATVVRGTSWLGGGIDRYIVDGAVNGVAWVVRSVGSQARRLQSGVVQNYVLVVFVGVAAIVALMRLL
jgi:NADH-quinone oxidoreductase subunit L